MKGILGIVAKEHVDQLLTKQAMLSVDMIKKGKGTWGDSLAGRCG